jgi:hypothetical protein
MTVRDNPVKRIMTVRKVSGRLVVEVEGTVRMPIKLKLRGIDDVVKVQDDRDMRRERGL